MPEPVCHPKLKGTPAVALYIELEHEGTKVVPEVGPIYIVYPHNGTLGPYKRCEHKHEGIAESAHSIDGTITEPTVDGTYPFVITSWPVHKPKGAEKIRPAMDVPVHVVVDGTETIDFNATTEDGARKTVDYLLPVGSTVITDAPAWITAKVGTLSVDVAWTVLEILVWTTGADDWKGVP